MTEANSTRAPVGGRLLHSYGVVILAAGRSSRMGQPKQMLPVAGRPLVVNAAEAALASAAWPVVVVVGAQAGLIKAALVRLPVLIAENPAWEEGMASSVRAGLATLEGFSRSIEGVIVALCDQPGFRSDTIAALVERQRTAATGIVAARYENRLGAPALFTARYFSALRSLRGEEGARQVIAAAAQEGDVSEVPLPALAFDLDTPEDYRRLLDHPLSST